VCSLASVALLGDVAALAAEYATLARALLDTAHPADPLATPPKASPLLPLLKVSHHRHARWPAQAATTAHNPCALPKTSSVRGRQAVSTADGGPLPKVSCQDKRERCMRVAGVRRDSASALLALRESLWRCVAQSVAVCEVELDGLLASVLAAMAAHTWRAKAARALAGPQRPTPRSLARLLKEVRTQPTRMLELGEDVSQSGGVSALRQLRS
jgi:hypothetical protein